MCPAFLATTYFRASDCFHLACNAWIWLDLIGRHLLPLERYATIKRNIIGNLESYKSIQSERVWLGVYGQGSMYDLAWELKNYEEGTEDPEVYTIISRLGVEQLEANRRCWKQKEKSQLKLVQGKFGQKSPYGESYK
jgi:hypothetical protein